MHRILEELLLTWHNYEYNAALIFFTTKAKLLRLKIDFIYILRFFRSDSYFIPTISILKNTGYFFELNLTKQTVH